MTITIKRTIGVNELGRRIGQNHHNAVLTNHDVELLLTMHEEGWAIVAWLLRSR